MPVTAVEHLPDGRVRVTAGAELDGPLSASTAWQDFLPVELVELPERGESG